MIMSTVMTWAGLLGLEPRTSSVSGCRCSGSGSILAAMTWAYARCALLGVKLTNQGPLDVDGAGPW
jgi:hypothetical protein